MPWLKGSGVRAGFKITLFPFPDDVYWRENNNLIILTRWSQIISPHQGQVTGLSGWLVERAADWELRVWNGIGNAELLPLETHPNLWQLRTKPGTRKDKNDAFSKQIQ